MIPKYQFGKDIEIQDDTDYSLYKPQPYQWVTDKSIYYKPEDSTAGSIQGSKENRDWVKNYLTARKSIFQQNAKEANYSEPQANQEFNYQLNNLDHIGFQGTNVEGPHAYSNSLETAGKYNPWNNSVGVYKLGLNNPSIRHEFTHGMLGGQLNNIFKPKVTYTPDGKKIVESMPAPSGNIDTWTSPQLQKIYNIIGNDVKASAPLYSAGANDLKDYYNTATEIYSRRNQFVSTYPELFKGENNQFDPMKKVDDKWYLENKDKLQQMHLDYGPNKTTQLFNDVAQVNNNKSYNDLDYAKKGSKLDVIKHLRK